MSNTQRNTLDSAKRSREERRDYLGATAHRVLFTIALNNGRRWDIRRILRELGEEADFQEMGLDSYSVKTHQASTSEKGVEDR